MGEKAKPIIKIFGVLDISPYVITMLTIIVAVAVLSLIVRSRLRERPGKLQNLVEAGVEYLDNFFSGFMGEKNGRKYLFYLGPLFTFILLCNYSGLIPGVGISPYFRAPTSSLSVTAGISLCTFFFIQISAIRAGAKHYLRHFLTPIVPLILLDELIKPASLSLRLFGNIFGEETVTENFYHLLPVGAPVIMMVLSLLFCAIQAMVYSMLTASYLNEFLED